MNELKIAIFDKDETSVVQYAVDMIFQSKEAVLASSFYEIFCNHFIIYGEIAHILLQIFKRVKPLKTQEYYNEFRDMCILFLSKNQVNLTEFFNAKCVYFYPQSDGRTIKIQSKLTANKSFSLLQQQLHCHVEQPYIHHYALLIFAAIKKDMIEVTNVLNTIINTQFKNLMLQPVCGQKEYLSKHYLWTIWWSLDFLLNSYKVDQQAILKKYYKLYKELYFIKLSKSSLKKRHNIFFVMFYFIVNSNELKEFNNCTPTPNSTSSYFQTLLNDHCKTKEIPIETNPCDYLRTLTLIDPYRINEDKRKAKECTVVECTEKKEIEIEHEEIDVSQAYEIVKL
jgi:hypothetical protein